MTSSQRFAVLALLLSAAACAARENPTYCDPSAPCLEAGTTCDVAGSRCIPDPLVVPCDDGDPSDCPGDEPFCTEGRCSTCTAAIGCGGVAPICDGESGACRRCDGASDCLEGTGRPVCAHDGRCVTCTPGEGCGGASPVCDADRGACRACSADDECTTACDETTGRCVEEDDAIFLAPDASPVERACTRLAPCRDLAAAALAAAGSRTWILMAPGDYAGSSLVWTRPRLLHVVAHGAAISALDGPALVVRGGGVELEGGAVHGRIDCDGSVSTIRPSLTLSGTSIEALDRGVDVIACDALLESVSVARAEVGVGLAGGAAVEANKLSITDVEAGIHVDGGVLTGKGITIERASTSGLALLEGVVDVAHARILDGGGLGVLSGKPTFPGASPTLRLHASEIAGNRGGGVRLTKGEYSITSTLIVENGNGSGPVAGVLIQAATGTFAFNTVVSNLGARTTRTEPGTPPVRYVTVAPPIRCELGQALTASIVEASPQGEEEPLHGCEITSSAWLDAMTPGGLICDPRFLDADSTTLARDYHLGAGSNCVDRALAGGVETDLDGDARPIGAAPDLGADEAR